MVFTDLALEDVGNTCEEEDKMEEVGIVDLMRTTSTHMCRFFQSYCRFSSILRWRLSLMGTRQIRQFFGLDSKLGRILPRSLLIAYNHNKDEQDKTRCFEKIKLEITFDKVISQDFVIINIILK